jgi:hypothetical protein
MIGQSQHDVCPSSTPELFHTLLLSAIIRLQNRQNPTFGGPSEHCGHFSPVAFPTEGVFGPQGGQHPLRQTIAPGPFAKQVVDRVLSTKEPSYIGKGTNAFLGWLLNAIRPRKIFDSWLDRAAGLDDAGLVDKIYQRAQRATERDL